MNNDEDNEKRLEAFIQDANAYLQAAAEVNQKPALTLLVLTHDISGLANHEPCFLPRVHGYAVARGTIPRGSVLAESGKEKK